MSVNFSTGYLDIDNREDRNTVAAILFKNGYTVSPVKTKKDGRSHRYFVKYSRDENNGKGGEML